MSRLAPWLTVAVSLLGLWGCDGGAGYQRQWTGGWTFGGTPFAPADPASFEPLGLYFGRDARQGYYRGSAVAGSDGRAVYYCDTYRKAQEYWAYQYLRIAPIPGADAASYQVLDDGYARDRHRAYDQGQPFAVREPASFEPLNKRFARDAQRGYFEHAEIPDSHGASLVLLHEDDPGYVRDRSRAWHGAIEVNAPRSGAHPVLRLLRGADMATLHVLGRGYAADARQVWYRGELLKKADVATFEVQGDVTGDVDAQDRAHQWQQGRVVVPAPAAQRP